MSPSPSLENRKKINRADGFVIGAVVMLALVLFFGTFLYAGRAKDGSLLCTITQDGEVVKAIELSSLQGEKTYMVGEVEILLTPTTVRIVSSSCDGQDCVHQGAITKAGESIVCLPNRIVVSLSSSQSSVDLVLG